MENQPSSSTTRIIGALSEPAIALEDLLELLTQENTPITHSGEFMGKATTCLKSNVHYVLKLHPDKKFSDTQIAARWLENLIHTEQASAIYHPSRTWFIHKHGSSWCIGNITKRLKPLHLFFESPNFPAEDALKSIFIVCNMYFTHVVRCEQRLDEGLSNFGFSDGKIYYLDDDIFAWDNFYAFTALIASWIRRYSHTWLNSKRARQLGEMLYKLLTKHFGHSQGIDAPHIVAEQLKDMFFPQGNIQDAATSICDILRSNASRHHTFLLPNPHHDSLDDVMQRFDDPKPIAILSDIHANLPALKAVLADIDKQHITRIFALGDLVGYGPHPNECLELLQSGGILSLRGNHDHAVGSGNMVSSMTSSSAHVAEWTIQNLKAEHRSFLLSLPLKMSQRPWMAVHGAPVDLTCFNAYIYQATALDNLKWVIENSYNYCLHGHSHYQGIYLLQDDKANYHAGAGTMDLSQERAALICPGSVGQPRGGVTAACYAIVHPRQRQVELHQVTYDIQHVIHDMIIHKFPEQLITRLKTGG